MVLANPGRRAYSSPRRREQAQGTRRRILDAACRLFTARGYGAVTVEDIAKEAGVAHQTVYAVFRTKLAMAQDIVWSSFHTEGIAQLMTQVRASDDLGTQLALCARMARRLNERFAPIARFMRESGDPALLAEFQKIEELRFEQIRDELSSRLRSSDRLLVGISPTDALASIWAVTGTDLYDQLVTGRRWTPSRYERWLKEVLLATLLNPIAPALDEPGR